MAQFSSAEQILLHAGTAFFRLHLPAGADWPVGSFGRMTGGGRLHKVEKMLNSVSVELHNVYMKELTLKEWIYVRKIEQMEKRSKLRSTQGWKRKFLRRS